MKNNIKNNMKKQKKNKMDNKTIRSKQVNFRVSQKIYVLSKHLNIQAEIRS